MVLGSGSSGNCYILDNGKEALVIEAGLPIGEVKQALDWKVNRIAGVVVSHCHGDHAGHLSEFLENGIKAFIPTEMIKDDKDISTVSLRPLEPKKTAFAGEFAILPLRAYHDVSCLAYVINHKDIGRLLFVTDTMMFPYSFKGLNHIMIEANYDDKVLLENIYAGLTPPVQRDRLMHTHFEISQTIAAVKQQDLSEVAEIVLMHLSDSNSSSNDFAERMASATGVPTYIARKGLILELGNNEKPY